nr:phosphoribosylformylglycinamidine cyclo-ligase [Desulfobacterales bacterium]
MAQPLTYADAGVDIDRANELVQRLKRIANETPRSGVVSEIGGFSGLFSLNVENSEQPVLVASTDGVGTKLRIASMMNKHDTVGIDLVAMCVNDIAVQGASPLFFLDYLSMGKLIPETAETIVRGIAEGCKQANCALIGGETAEMPGFYAENEYDLAGFVVGIVDNSRIVDGSEIGVGHKLIGVASSGLHSNGYSLVRKICFERLGLKLEDRVDLLGKTLGEVLIEPTKIYSDLIQKLIRDLPIHGLSHITGGGIIENLPRILPSSCCARIEEGSWEIPPIFHFLRESGNISNLEMLRTFNNGIGLIIVVPESAVDDVLERVAAIGERAYIIGDIVQRKGSEDQIIVL